MHARPDAAAPRACSARASVVVPSMVIQVMLFWLGAAAKHYFNDEVEGERARTRPAAMKA